MMSDEGKDAGRTMWRMAHVTPLQVKEGGKFTSR